MHWMHAQTHTPNQHQWNKLSHLLQRLIVIYRIMLSSLSISRCVYTVCVYVCDCLIRSWHNSKAGVALFRVFDLHLAEFRLHRPRAEFCKVHSAPWIASFMLISHAHTLYFISHSSLHLSHGSWWCMSIWWTNAYNRKLHLSKFNL